MTPDEMRERAEICKNAADQYQDRILMGEQWLMTAEICERLETCKETERTSVKEGFQALADASGGTWDNVDAAQYVDKLRNRKRTYFVRSEL